MGKGARNRRKRKIRRVPDPALQQLGIVSVAALQEPLLVRFMKRLYGSLKTW